VVNIFGSPGKKIPGINPNECRKIEPTPSNKTKNHRELHPNSGRTQPEPNVNDPELNPNEGELRANAA
jgi:hypothetical protein